MAERTAMMDQYRRAKSRHQDAVLFFRLGDFYEMFFEDAVEVSALLNLTLTKRQGEPMCGVPYHAARSYIARLLKLGKKIALCEQLSEPGQGKIVERDVVEVITPGTALEEDFLDQGANNYLLALCEARGRLCLSYVDISTAEFRAFSFPAGLPALAEERLRKEFYRLAPREALVQQSLLERPEVAAALGERNALIVNRLPDWSFDAVSGAEELRRRFGLATLKGLGFEDDAPELAAAAALLRYVDDAAKATAPHLRGLRPYLEEDYALVDESSQKNLEIVQNLHDSSRAYSLLEVLDETRSAPGARLIRQWLLQPLRRRGAVEARLAAVDFLYRDQRLLRELREALGRLLDAERLASRVAMDKAHAKDLLALRDSIAAAEAARALLAAAGAPGLLAAGPTPEEAEAEAGLRALVDRAIMEEPSILLSEGDLIRPGYDPELDRLRAIKEDSRSVLEAYLEEERRASGISNLRVRYNRIIGYYLEVSKGKLEAVPAHFVRRQSLVNGERYSTARLAELESEINGATERIVELERRLFVEVRERAKLAVPALLAMAGAAAVQDCLASFAWAATVRGYSRPVVHEDGRLRIVEGRHPVVEAHLPAGAFQPNGLELSADLTGEGGKAGGGGAGGPAPASFALITGPNMAGKSTFLRQTALIALMAQAGSFVPALEADIGLVDRIFCRVGAQDNLARGESTFLVEMHETARILNTATAASLVVMDEVGRGTSTIDGLSIAWAVSEELLAGLGCRSLFATHYHELTALEHPRLKNLSLAVLEEEGEVVFLKRIEEGAAAGSYGLHVARLAGLPVPVLARAAEVHAELSRKEKILPGAGGRGPAGQGAAGAAGAAAIASAGHAAGAEAASGARSKAATAAAQGGLFSPGDLVLAELASLDIDSLAPLEALNRLAI
ncbi:MAG: DNA mismatch repair protein MutS, partial [Spirochaetaceae bacterium]|nr:DNA mismatch repair protein MutS [Spirochaetaceae bacterium]